MSHRPRCWKALVAGVLAAALSPVHAAIDCWMDAEHPQTSDQLRVTDARAAPTRDAVRRLNALLHAMQALHALPRTRLRSSWQIAGQWNEPARAANFLLRDHRESMWVGRCDVHKGADRLSPRISVVALFNAPARFFETAAPEIKDDQLQAWREVLPSGSVKGHTLYGGHMLVFTRSGKLPWVPVSTAEYLDFTERDLSRRLQEVQASEAAVRQAMLPAEQEAMIERVVEGFRKANGAQADKLAAELRAQYADAHKAAQAREARRLAHPTLDHNPYQTMLGKVRAYRASLSPGELSAPARLGVTGLHPADQPIERQPGLVKPDPSFAWDRQAPASAQMLMVSVRGGQEFEGPMQEVLHALDVDALQALVQGP